MSEERNLIDELAKRYKKEGSSANVGFYTDSSTDVKSWVSTGNVILDTALSNRKNGGIPVGRLTEISGTEGAGKTLLASYILANTQKMGGVAILIDSENAASKEIMESDINVAIKKAKVKHRYNKEFYILDYSKSDSMLYFASTIPDKNKETKEEIYAQKWIFDVDKNRWEEVK